MLRTLSSGFRVARPCDYRHTLYIDENLSSFKLHIYHKDFRYAIGIWKECRSNNI